VRKIHGMSSLLLVLAALAVGFGALAAAVVIVLAAYPQPWLVAEPGLTAEFWLPLVIASVQLALRLCPACRNDAYPIHARCAKPPLRH
jgi:hypothetical protein